MNRDYRRMVKRINRGADVRPSRVHWFFWMCAAMSGGFSFLAHRANPARLEWFHWLLSSVLFAGMGVFAWWMNRRRND